MKHFFGGSIGNIELVRDTRKPTLFKEFVYTTQQIDGANYYGYDAVLLIKKIFSNTEELKKLVVYCLEKNIEPLIEVDNQADLGEILSSFTS
jgi:indole-3-glycerol phosphate synthase